MTVRAAITEAAARFGFSATPRLDAELLLAHALGITRERLLLDPPAAVPDGFAALVERRAAHEPIAYITGTRAFWTIELAVGPGVLVPRADSETLIEAAVAHFAGTPGPRDDPRPRHRAGHAAARGARPMAGGAREWAWMRRPRRSNTPGAMRRRSEWRSGVTFSEGDWTDGLTDRFDLILCNPPYIGTDEALPPEVAES